MKKTGNTILLVLAGIAAFIAGFIGYGTYSMFKGFSTAHTYKESGPAALASLKKIVLVENFQNLEDVESYAVFLFQDGVTWYRFTCDGEDINAIAAALGASDTYPVALVNGQPVTYGYRMTYNGVPQDWGEMDNITMEYANDSPPWWRPDTLDGAIVYKSSACKLIYQPSTRQCYLEAIDT